ncbi:MAG: hypothetical protein OHK0038_21810 [Flammeovirgaceae bacterium]
MSFQSISDRISKVFYKILIGWGIFWTLIAIFGLFSVKNNKQDDLITGLAVLLLFGLFPAGIGYFFLSRQTKRRKEKLDADIEINLVRLAKQKNGRLLVPDVVSSLGVTTNVARKMLEDLNLKGVFEVEVTPDGVIEYRLSGYSDKNNS